ncbi:MAG: menaquinone biosynthetic enzyme MqnA/MqnD family protein [Bryobacteraceae bacterium]
MPLKLCSVDFLNSAPLVWGLLHGPQRGLFDLRFEVPSVCADLLRAGEVDIGNVPVIEYARQGLTLLRGAGVACHGPVRSILLISRVPFESIRTLAADTSSRTSTQLARIILARRYGAFPELLPRPPALEPMLAEADAALIIGDPALRIDPRKGKCRVLDLGGEWVEMTGLPMVFAVWAGRQEAATAEVEDSLRASCRYGLEHLEEVIVSESAARGLPPDLSREYLTSHIVNELGHRDYQGMELYLRYAHEMGAIEDAGEERLAVL